MCSVVKIISLYLYVTLGQASQQNLLNIEELNSIHYNIDIGKNPVLKHQEWNAETVAVTNKHGQEYICELPKIEFPETESKKDEDILDQLVDISELLKPMEAAPCLIKRKDWWTYEFCYGSVIKQYRLEDNRVSGAILVLGIYESEYNWKNSSETKNKLQKFHSQFYVNGTSCDITGEPRRTEVRFHCEEGAGDYIQLVDEPESCRYVVTIATTRVCHHPYLKTGINKSPHSITCSPALDQHQFDRYQKFIALKRKDLNDQDSVDEKNEDESKWSIRLLTFPAKKKAKNLWQKVEIDEEKVPEYINVPSGSQDSLSQASKEDIKELPAEATPKEVKIEEEDLNLEAKKDEDKDSKKPNNWKEELRKKIDSINPAKHDQTERIQSIRAKMDKVLQKQIQEGNHEPESLANILLITEERFNGLEKHSSKMSFSKQLLDQLYNMMKVTVDELEEVDIRDDERINHQMDSISKSAIKMSEDIAETEKEMDSLEKLLDLQLLEDAEEKKDPIKAEDSTTDEETKEIDNESTGKSEGDNTKTESSQVGILNDPSVEESHKVKLERSIKERLQKDNLGRKIEVKILTPKNMDEEQKDTLASLSKEETEAFHNVIVNILSANAEEINEKERQSILESNYNFQIEEFENVDLEAEAEEESTSETVPSDAQEEH